MDLRDKNLLRSACLVNGQWLDHSEKFEVRDPFDQSLIVAVPDADAAMLEHAISAANQSFPAWRDQSAYKRSALLNKWFNLIVEHVEDLALLLSKEMGKTLSEARSEISYGADYIKWFAEEAIRVYGDTIPSKNTDQRVIVLKQAIGPVAIITPWNFPNAMITRKLAPALAAGCTVVIKPAADTPLSALAIGYLAQQAGIPAGVINIITTQHAQDIGKSLCEDLRIKKLSFTGSTEVGKILMTQSGSSLKKLSMELGGNASFTVFEDANLEHALSGLMACKFRNSGQTCVCANRIFLHEKVHDAFLERLSERISKLKVGRGTERNTTITPLINAAAVDKIRALLKDALDKGAVVIKGGNALETRGANFFEPTLLINANASMRLFKEEIFGPVVAVYKFRSDEELLEMANNTDHGLASYFYTGNPSRIWNLAEKLECGMIGINTGIISNVSAPFGGVKHSGFGREGSKYGIEEYVNIKYLNWQID